MRTFDTAIIGGGIVGLALGYEMMRTGVSKSIVIIEKETVLLKHQSGHNSGVIHSGLYYPPGSAKAKSCLAGKIRLEQLCSDVGIPFETCGKVVVATSAAELPRLEKLVSRAQAHKIPCRSVSAAELREIEPHVSGLQGLYVPGTGIISFPAVGEYFATELKKRDNLILTDAAVVGINHAGSEINLETKQGAISARLAVNCAGLYCDKVAELGGLPRELQIIPFRGEYYKLKKEHRHLCRNLIYPVPDPAFPFLGVHFTRMISGEVECGPNAVLAFAREGYTKTNVHFPELIETLLFPGFRAFAKKHWRMGLMEMWRSFSKAAFVASLQRLVPEIQAEMLEPAPAGIRAQAVRVDGSLVDDFLIKRTGKMVHVLNAPSPAATSCLGIAERIIEELG